MPEPQAQPEFPRVRRVAMVTLVAGVILLAGKFFVFTLTNSAAVLSDALESLVNVGAAAMVSYSIWLSNQPADRGHPYGHGKVESLVVGVEGLMILLGGLAIAWQGIVRLIDPPTLSRLGEGIGALAVITALSLGLSLYVLVMGRRHRNANLTADGLHLLTDVGTSLAMLVGLTLVQRTGHDWIDPAMALGMAALIFWTSARLLRGAVAGLMDQTDPRDEAAIRRVLDEEVGNGAILNYHKLRHRHSGPFHWVEMHLQVDGDMSVRESHALASRIEHRIEQMLGQANATAHVEPQEAAVSDAAVDRGK